MRVALFSSSIDTLSGYGNITFEFCTELQRKGIAFELFLPCKEEQRVRALSLTFPVRCILPPYFVRTNLLNVWSHFRTIDVSDFDLVHSLLDFPHCFIAARSARTYRKPFIMGSQGTYGVMPLTYLPDRWMLRYAFRTAKRIVVPSTFTKEMIQTYAGESYPIDVIHNGVNFARFQKKVDLNVGAYGDTPLPLREQFPGKLILLTVGNFKERRGQDLILHALALLKKKRSDFAYLLVGGGSYRAVLERLTDELGLRAHVAFLGQLPGDELLRPFQACDIYVHTPRVYRLNFEGFGIVYLEASACGKPIVATDAGGIRDAVKDSETGIVVPDGDIPAIADALERLLDDPELRLQMGRVGRTYAQENDWSRIVDQFLRVYEDVFKSCNKT